MIAVVSGAAPEPGVEDFRWIGDTTLFWSGLYPEALPRIGLQATAKIHGRRVTLFYYLFRRPLAQLRQFTGL